MGEGRDEERGEGREEKGKGRYGWRGEIRDVKKRKWSVKMK